MHTATFRVENIKCAGCVQMVRDAVAALPGVECVEVELESGCVSVFGSAFERAAVAAKLADIGYPEAP